MELRVGLLPPAVIETEAHEDMRTGRRRTARHSRIEWPTIALAGAIYGGFGTLTWLHGALPIWLIVALSAWLGAWHGSLQHEIVHGHPTRWRRVNHLLAWPSLGLWLPFGIYRASHLAHHVDSRLTDPTEDPETFYVSPQVWSRLGRIRRGLLWIHNTVAGRLIIGPWRLWARFYRDEGRRLAAGDGSHVKHWARHLPGVALALGWALGVCGMPLWQYLLGFVYGGTALTLLRSFLEHRAAEQVGERTAVVEAGPALGLLYLHNNLHAVHHARPALPWYRLPAAYRAERSRYLAGNGGYLYKGYGDILRRHLIRPKEPPVHPVISGPRLEASGEHWSPRGATALTAQPGADPIQSAVVGE